MGINAVVDTVGEAAEKVNYVVETGKAHTQGAYNQLLEEDNLLARVGVIDGSATLGLLVGVLRGRLAKRVVYTTVGGVTGAAACYPDTASTVGGELYTEIRKKGLIAYNFVNGVEPTSGNVESSSLIAASLTRFSRVLFAKLSEVWHKIKPRPAEIGSEVEVATSKKDFVIFEKSGGSQISADVAGDPGQGKVEDKDLYTTRQ